MIGALLAACHQPTAREIAWNKAAREQVDRENVYNETYDHCINRVTGLFAAASIDVMRECARQAKEASERPLP